MDITQLLKTFKSSGATLLTSNGTTDFPNGVLDTGSLVLNRSIGVGGLPRGRVIHIYGPEASGKTTLSLSTVARAQRAGLVCAYLDMEHALVPLHMQKIGVDLDNLVVFQPDSAEDCLNTMISLVTAVDLIILDSVAALTPKAEIEGNVGDANIGLQARLLGQALRKLIPLLSKNNCTVIFINQTRANIGGYGSPEVTPGGNALKFASSVVLTVRKQKSKAVKLDGDYAAIPVNFKIEKNKVGSPYKEGQFTLWFSDTDERLYGIVTEQEVLEQGLSTGVLKRNGAWYYYRRTVSENEDTEEIRLGQGKQQSILALVEDQELYKEIRDAVKLTLGLA